MASEQDRALSNELAHLIQATASPEGVAANTAFRRAIAEARARCQQAKAELDRAAKAVDDDTAQNQAAAAAFTEAFTACLDEFRVLAGNVKNRLLNLRADDRAALGAAEMSKREAFIASNIDLPPSRIAELGRTAAINRLRSVHDRLAQEPAYVPPVELAPFAARLQAAEQAHAAVVAEALDDQPLYDSLFKARFEAQSCRVAFRSLLDAVLRFEHSPVDVDQFLLRASHPASPTDPQAPPTPPTPAGPSPVV